MIITEKYLKSLCSSNTYSRGLAYYKNQAVKNPERDGMTLLAEVQGSDYQPYRVRVTLNESGIEEFGCTCPYDFGGLCKHQVALLLKFIHEPETFLVHQPLAQLLANHNREALIVIIERMISREPELRNLLSLPIPGQTSKTKPINLDGYRRQLERYLNDFDNEDRLLQTVYEVHRTAQDFLKAGDTANAIKIYGCILDVTIADDNFQNWGRWQLIEAVDNILRSLLDCMKLLKDEADSRRTILTYWLKATVWNLEEGGIGFADESEDWITTYIKAEDIPSLRPILENASTDEWSAEYIEAYQSRFDILEGKDPEQAYKRMLDKGLYELYFNHRLEDGKLDLALSVWQHLSSYERFHAIQNLASKNHHEEAWQRAEQEINKQTDNSLLLWLLNDYEKHKDFDKAVSLAERMLKTTDKASLQTWLIAHYERHKNPEKLLYWNLEYFTTQPSLPAYSNLKAAAQNLNQWEKIESEVLKLVEKSYPLLVRIQMKENRFKEAWQSLELAKNSKAQSHRHYAYEPNPLSGLDLELAEAAEKQTPKESIAVYLKYARLHINYRQRSAYAEAAQFLRKIQSVYLKILKDPDGWQKLITEIREEFKTLRAMHDEFTRAGLYK